MEYVEFGKAVKLHGFLGQLKITTKYDKDFDIKKIDKLYDDNKKEYVVTKIFVVSGGVVVTLEGVGQTEAKTFIGKMFFIDRSLVSGKILFEDLKGSTIVFESGKTIGTIFDVQDFGAAEVIYVKTETGKEIMFPNVDGVIKQFDYHNKKLTVESEKFRQVCDYEN